MAEHTHDREIAAVYRTTRILTGPMTITVVGNDTHFTFQFYRPDPSQSRVNVKARVGRKYVHLGTIFQPEGDGSTMPVLGQYGHGSRSEVERTDPAAKAAVWLFGPARGLERDDLTVYECTRCPKCTELLTHPDSIIRGVGPVCATR